VLFAVNFIAYLTACYNKAIYMLFSSRSTFIAD